MSDHVCVESAFDEAMAVVRASGNDRIIFPHVDSCMAVIFVLLDQTLIGGHASQYDTATKALNPSLSLDTILVRMLASAESTIGKVIFIGDVTSDWGGAGWQVSQKIATFQQYNRTAPQFAKIDTFNCGKGVDIFVDRGDLRLRMQHFQPGSQSHSKAAPPLRSSPVYDEPLAEVRDYIFRES